MNRKGFTLIELLVVVAVLALLASIVFSNLGGAREGARISNALSFQSQTHSLLGSDLVGWWNFNEGSGTTARDISGYDNHGNIIGATYVEGVPGTGGTALEFNGSSDYVYLGTKTESPEIFPREEITIAGWYYLYSVGGGSVFNNAVDCHSSYEIQERGDARWRFYINVEDLSWRSCRADNVVVESEKWHYVVGSYKSNGFHQIYIDGELGNTCGPYNKLISDPGSNHTRIGSMSGGGRWFHGLIDDVRIYSRALTASEIQTLYTQTKDKYLANE